MNNNANSTQIHEKIPLNRQNPWFYYLRVFYLTTDLLFLTTNYTNFTKWESLGGSWGTIRTGLSPRKSKIRLISQIRSQNLTTPIPSFPLLQDLRWPSSTTSESMSSTSVRRCRRCRQTDVDDVDFEVMSVSYLLITCCRSWVVSPIHPTGSHS